MTNREYHERERQRVVERMARLPRDSALRQVFDTVTLPIVDRLLNQSSEDQLTIARWPMFYGLLATCDDGTLEALENDVLALAQACGKRSEQIASILKQQIGGHPGKWYGDLFDIHIKAVALRAFANVELDAPLHDSDRLGKNTDIRCQVGRKMARFESTVIVQDDEARFVFRRYLADWAEGKCRSLIRPGSYDPPNAKGPSPYYGAARLYTKLFDKIARDFDPARTQLADTEPNVLCLSFAGLGMSASQPEVAWVLDELFAEQPRSRGDANTPSGSVALMNWIERRADELMLNGKLDEDQYIRLYDDQTLLQLIQRISAITLFDGGRFHSARLNYNCHERVRISHATMARIERAFRKHPCRYVS